MTRDDWDMTGMTRIEWHVWVILHVIVYPVKATGVAECLDEGESLRRGTPVYLK